MPILLVISLLGSRGRCGAAARLPPPFFLPKSESAVRTIVYIDGFNLYYRLKEADHRGNEVCHTGERRHYKWLDLGKLIECILKNPYEVVKIKYFTSLVKYMDDDPSKPVRQQTYMRAIRTIGNLEIVRGNFKKRNISGRLLTSPKNGEFELGEIVRIQKFEEKESDVNIACHIVADSAQEDIDCVTLLSNDTDLLLPLKMAKEKFHKKVCLISPRTTHKDLDKIADFKRRITNNIITACQFPDVVNGIHRPHNW